jgi:gliding-associated putative ABC transporter substrate-binding component GldG
MPGKGKLQMKTDSIINRLIIFTIIICINIVSLYVFQRWDMTRSKAYSLSTATKNVISNIDDQVKIRLFFSKNLPAPIQAIRNYTSDLLTEYQTHSRGRVVYEFVNPDSEDRFILEATRAKIASVAVKVFEKNREELRDVYMGASISYRNQTILIPFLNESEGLEFRFTNVIKKLTEPRERHIAYFQPLNDFERSLPLEYQIPMPPNIRELETILRDVAVLDRTNLLFPLPATTDLLIVNAVVDSLHLVQLYNIDQFIMRGRPVIILADRYIADLNRSPATLFDNNLLDLLRHHGIYVNSSLVLDAYCEQVTRHRMQGDTLVPENFNYPFFPIYWTFSDDIPIHKNLSWVQSFYASPILHMGGPLTEQRLLITSNNTSNIAGFTINTTFQQYHNVNLFERFTQSHQSVVSQFTGPVTSFFSDKHIRAEGYIDTNPQATIVVAGASSLLNNELLANIAGNRAFVHNLIDYLTGETEFIAMRNRNVTFSPLIDLPSDDKNAIKYLNMILPFALIVCFAIVFRMRINAHKRWIRGQK